VSLAVDDHADAMRSGAEEDHHLCVIVVVGVVAYDRRLDVMLRELTQELEPMLANIWMCTQE